MGENVRHPRRSHSRSDFPEPIISNPTLEHRQSFIILHGRGSNGEDFGKALLEEEIPGYINLPAAFPHAKFIFPTAAVSRATIYKKSPIHQWFDNWNLERPTDREELQINGLEESTRFIHLLIEQEIEKVGIRNVILGGLSQGCAMTLISLLLWNAEPLPVAFGMCGWLPFRSHLEGIARNSKEENANSVDEDDEDLDDMFDRSGDDEPEGEDARGRVAKDPTTEALNFLTEMLDQPLRSPLTLNFQRTSIFLGHGRDDDRVPVALGREAVNCLAALGVSVKWQEYENLGHWYSGNMLNDLVAFINLRFPSET